MQTEIKLKIIFAWLLVCIQPAAAQYYQTSYAVVIGINEYPNWTDFSYAKRDAKGMATYLQNNGFKVEILYDRQATKTNIISKMQNIARGGKDVKPDSAAGAIPDWFIPASALGIELVIFPVVLLR